MRRSTDVLRVTCTCARARHAIRTGPVESWFEVGRRGPTEAASHARLGHEPRPSDLLTISIVVLVLCAHPLPLPPSAREGPPEPGPHRSPHRSAAVSIPSFSYLPLFLTCPLSFPHFLSLFPPVSLRPRAFFILARGERVRDFWREKNIERRKRSSSRFGKCRKRIIVILKSDENSKWTGFRDDIRDNRTKT